MQWMVGNKEVIFRGIVDLKKKGSATEFRNTLKSKKFKQILGMCGLKLMCFTP